MAKKKTVSPGVEADDEPQVFRFIIDGKPYELDINPDHLPLRDRIGVEEYLNIPWVEAAVSGWMTSNKAIAYFAYLALRKKRPQAELEDVLNAKKLEIEEVEDEPDRPTKTRGKSGSRS